MILSTSTLDDLAMWSRSSGLEIILIISGAVLLVRALHVVAQGSLLRQPSIDSSTPEPEVNEGRRKAVTQAVGWLTTAVISVIAGAMAADRFGIPLATLIPTASVAGVALGFGAQRIVQDILSGFFLLAESQLEVGDWVTISDPGTTGGVNGMVEEVTLRVTRLRTVEGEVVFIPNGEIRQVTNQSVEWARLVVDVPLRPEVDLERALTALRQVCDEMSQAEAWSQQLLHGPEVLGVQAINVGVMQVRVVARVAPNEQWSTARELRRRIALGLSGAGIEPVTPLMIPAVTP